MIYVPQFKAPTPAGSRDIDFDHFYEPEVFCPANSVVYMDLFSWAATPWSDGGPDRVWLTGVKRFGQQSPCGEEVVCG
jgi:hypothetical protein